MCLSIGTALAVPISFQGSLDGLAVPISLGDVRDATCPPVCFELDAHPVLNDLPGDATRAHPVNGSGRMLGAVFSRPMDIER